MMRTQSRKKALQDSSYMPAKSHFNPRPFARPMAEQEVDNLKAVSIGDQLRQLFEKQDLFSLVQPKLIESKAGDIYEKEADRVSEQVMRMLKPDIRHHAEVKGGLQRKPVQLPGVNSRMRAVSDQDAFIPGRGAGGRELPGKLQGTMNQAFGVDFSGVRIHADTESDRLNRSLHARAFTVGQDIFFRKGEYDAQSNQGQRLLSHELTHVVQQAGGMKLSHVLRRGVYNAEQEIKAASYPSIQRSPDIGETTPEIIDPWESQGPYSVRWEMHYNQVISRQRGRQIIRPRVPSDQLIINEFVMRPNGESPINMVAGQSVSPAASRRGSTGAIRSGPIELGPVSHPRNTAGYLYGAITYATREGGRQEAPTIPAQEYPAINSNKLIIARVELGAERSEQRYRYSSSREETTTSSASQTNWTRTLDRHQTTERNDFYRRVSQSLTQTAIQAVDNAIQNYNRDYNGRRMGASANGRFGARGFARIQPEFELNIGADRINLGEIVGALLTRSRAGSRLLRRLLGGLLDVTISAATRIGSQGDFGFEAGGELGIGAFIESNTITDRQRLEQIRTTDARRSDFTTAFEEGASRSIEESYTSERENISSQTSSSGQTLRSQSGGELEGRQQVYENIQPSIFFMQTLDDPHPPVTPQSGTTATSRATR